MWLMMLLWYPWVGLGDHVLLEQVGVRGRVLLRRVGLASWGCGFGGPGRAGLRALAHVALRAEAVVGVATRRAHPVPSLALRPPRPPLAPILHGHWRRHGWGPHHYPCSW